jgi:hypothetical protein
VRSTVTNFYNLFTPVAIDVCPLDSKTADLRAQNAAQLAKCSANKIQVFIDMLQAIRLIVNTLIQCCVYLLEIIITLFKLLIVAAEDVPLVLKQLKEAFMNFLFIQLKLIVQEANLLFKMVFNKEGGFGKAMLKLQYDLCMWFNKAYAWFRSAYCNVVTPMVIPILDFVIKILEGLQELLIPTDSAIAQMQRTKAKFLEDNTKYCENTEPPLTCMEPEADADKFQSGTTPLATRCWADYVPDSGDSNALSCNAADTCEKTLSTDGLQVCDSCPLQSGTLKFGCDILTKKCTCNRLPTTYTSCVTNQVNPFSFTIPCHYLFFTFLRISQECFLPGMESICRIVSDINTLSSFGNAPCKQCNTDSICLVSAGNSIGQCVCPLTNLRPQSCSQLGRTTQLSYHGLCVTDISTATRNKAITMLSWKDVATAPCSLITPSSGYCYDVKVCYCCSL